MMTDAVAPHEAPKFFADAMHRHGRCCCSVDADGGFCGECSLCAALPRSWRCPTIDHAGYPLPVGSAAENGREVGRLQAAGRVLLAEMDKWAGPDGTVVPVVEEFRAALDTAATAETAATVRPTGEAGTRPT